MKTAQLSMVAVLLAAGCAHGNQSEAHSARDEARGDRAAESDSVRGKRADARERGEPDAVQDEQNGERVDLSRRGDRGHMASAGAELPADKQTHPSGQVPAAAYGVEADNTRVNERDRESSALTPMDQGENEKDRDMTQAIRKAVIADDSLSFTAKNVKIITRDGLVTLRGAVNNAREKATLERTALSLAGPKRVVNELEVSE